MINDYLPATPTPHTVLLVADAGVLHAGVLAPLASTMRTQHRMNVYGELHGEPTAASITDLAAHIQQIAPTVLIAAGGGSALDAAKLAASVAAGTLPVDAYALMQQPLPPRQMPLIAIPTTAGTGAEVTRTVVFTNSAGRKVWGWAEHLLPDQAILDPVLTTSLPAPLTAMTGLDALVHGVEASTNRRSTPITQAYGLHAIRLVAENLLPALTDPADLTARGNLLVAAMLAGLAIDAAGTGLAHGIGHALGTLAGIPHGRGVALALDAIYPANATTASESHARIARALGVQGDMELAALAQAGATAYHHLLQQSGVEQSLQRSGLTLADADRLVETIQAPENVPIWAANCYLPTTDELHGFATALLAR